MKKILLVLPLLAVITYFVVGGGETKEVYKKMPDTIEKATFAGGCFWCTEAAFEDLDGIYDVVSGYTGGQDEDPTYEEVSSGKTGHYEAVQISFDPETISYTKLLDLFWRSIDPTDAGGQFADRGSQYKTAIFYHSSEQKNQAEKSREKLGGSGRFEEPIVTEILESERFYPAEEYHQDYSKKRTVHYQIYKKASGRDSYLKEAWKDDYEKKQGGEDDLKERLTRLQYYVTQNSGTEPPFANKYWDNTEEGIYVDVVSGEPLFSSEDKYKSGTGWPSFTKPIDYGSIVEREDKGILGSRTEIRSKVADSHLGHVFDDGPEPTGKRYCMNSAALRFIPQGDLEKEGYGEYQRLFERNK